MSVGTASNSIRATSSQQKIRCSFGDFVTTYQRDLEKELLQAVSERGCLRCFEEAENRAFVRDALVDGGYLEFHDFKDSFELLGVVWTLSEQ